MDLEAEFAQHRAALVAHCYRMLGSLHDAEDAVQETYLRAWRGQTDFEQRSSVKTWLYRIATNVCLNSLQHSSRRVVPSALGAPGHDPDELQPDALEVTWLELREVLAWSAAEVAVVLDTTTAGVNSALQRARAELARLHPVEEDLSEPDEPVRRALLDQFAAAFESKDLVALEGLLTADTRWEMPPIPTWFSGRTDVLRLLDAKLDPGRGFLVETSANGQPAFALYNRGGDGRYHAHSIKVLTLTTSGIAAVMAFHHPALFPAFGLPLSRPSKETP